MALESGTYVKDLVSTNPPGTDAISQGDDHIRLVKSVLKNSFPSNSNAPIVPDMSGQSGKYLTTDGTDSSWGTITQTLSGLTDTTISSPASNQRLTYNGSTWVNTSDITIPSSSSLIINSGATITINSGATITNNGTNGGGFGKVLQVVHVEDSTYGTTTASMPNSAATSGQGTEYISATITPSSASNKILIILHSRLTAAGGSWPYASSALFRNTVNLCGGWIGGYPDGDSQTKTLLDSPNTTSAVTYSGRYGIGDTATIASTNGLGAASPTNIILMEIEG